MELATQILARLGLTPDALQCGVHPPLHRPTAQALVKAGLETHAPAQHLHRQTRRHAGPVRPPRLARHGLPESGPPGPGADFGHRGPDGGISQRANPGGHRRLRRPGLLRAFEKHRPGICPPGGGAAGVARGHPHGRHPGPSPGTSPGTAVWRPRSWRPCRAKSSPSPGPKGAMA